MPSEPDIDFRALTEAVPAIVWETEPASLRYRYVSSGAERLLGYPLECWTGEPDFWLAHLHPEDREWAPVYCEQAAAADGRTVWATGQRIRREVGQPSSQTRRRQRRRYRRMRGQLAPS